jgi:hypothetical protein
VASRSVLADVVWGVQAAFWFAGFFGVFALLAWLLDRAEFVRTGFTLPRAAAYFLTLAVVIGTVIGLLRPWGQSRGGMVLMGWIGGTLFVAIAGLFGGAPPGLKLLLISAIIGLPGALVGSYIWRRLKDLDRRPPAI